jgi:hypothetical protein
VNVRRGWEWRRWARAGDPYLWAARDMAASLVAFSGAAKIRRLPKPQESTLLDKCAISFGDHKEKGLTIEALHRTMKAAYHLALAGMSVGELNDWHDGLRNALAEEE